MKQFLYIHIFLFWVGFINGQDYYFNHYQVEDGLSHNTVSSTLQDSTGFLWIGTKDGLNRFDGYQFKVYRHNEDQSQSLGSNYIRCLHEFKGFIWVGTDSGLFRYSKKNETFELIEITKGIPILDIESDINDDLWFIEAGKLKRLSLKDDDQSSYTIESYNKFYCLFLASTEDGKIWAASFREIYEYIKENNSFLKHENINFDSSSDITAFDTRGKSLILIGTKNNGAFLYNHDSHEITHLLKKENESLIIRCFLNKENEIWIGNELGVYIAHIKDDKVTHIIKSHNDPYSLSDNAIYTLLEDREKGIWIGTYFGGLNYYPSSYTHFKKYFPKVGENSISGSAVREIKEDKYGNLWIGTEDAGLNKYNPSTNTFQHFTAKSRNGMLAHYNIHGLLVENDRLWIGTFEKGIDVLDIRTNKVIKHYDSENSNIVSNFILYIYKDRNGNLYFLTSTGIYKYNDDIDDFILFNAFPESFHYTYFLEDSEGIFWAGTYWDGLYFYNPKTGDKGLFKTDENDPNSISSNLVNGIFEDHENNLWITTENGLNLFDPENKKFKRYKTENGLPSNVIYSFQESEGIRWISTSRGLVKYDHLNGIMTNFSKNHGLLSDQFNYNSSFKDKNGLIYFGSVNGLISFDPSAFKPNKYSSPITITNLSIHNKDVDVYSKDSPLLHNIQFEQEITLRHDQSSFSLDFSNLSFSEPNATQYWYMMENLYDEWTPLENSHTVNFIELPAGNYTFKVKSQNSHGVWSKESTPLKITIKPYFLFSIWAYMIYALLAILLLLFFLKYYHEYNVSKHEQKLISLEKDKEKELYEAKINFFTTIAHEIRTPLTLIINPLERLLQRKDTDEYFQNNLEIMEKNSSRLIDLTNQMLDFRSTEKKKVELNFQEKDIKKVINSVYSRFLPSINEKNLSLKLSLPENPLVSHVDEEILTKVVSNLLSNALKYSQNFIQLIVQEKAQEIVITVENDGDIIPDHARDKIFEPFYRIAGNNQVSGTGIGLSIAKSLAELHGGSLELTQDGNPYNRFVFAFPRISKAQKLEDASNIMENKDESSAAQIEEVQEITDNNIEDQASSGKIMIVEDNEELLSFLKSELILDYKIETAKNGQIALEKLQETRNIELVISDVMMPVMNGIELCNVIKKDIELNHIPVILLTAKTAMEAQILGLESGADAYITKPFSMEFLKVQIKSLIKNRKSILVHYAHSPLSHLKELELSKLDQEFVEQLDVTLHQHLSNFDLNVAFLAEHMNMSRSTLYRKIKEISNMTPNELINVARLKKAAQLLRTSNLKVYQIAEKVGYKSQTSFGRNFQKFFNETPSSYANN